MISSRLYYASMMLFWVCYLTLLALVVIYAPQGGVALAGFTLFSDTGLIATALEAMQAIGLSAFGQSVVFGLLGGFSAASAGLLLFAMMFMSLARSANSARHVRWRRGRWPARRSQRCLPP
jgi:hypothetical protein